MSSWDALENYPCINNSFSPSQWRELKLICPVFIAKDFFVRASTPEDVLYYKDLLIREFAHLTPPLKSSVAAVFPAHVLAVLGVQECTPDWYNKITISFF